MESHECLVVECGRPSRSGRMCTMHYQRLKKNGSTDKPPSRRTSVTCGHPERPHGAKGLCHPCYMTIWNREHPDGNSGPGWKKRNPEQAAVYKRKLTLKRHGLTIEDYAEMWTRQSGRCANAGCGAMFALIVPDYRNGLQVDHDHATGLVRGLLCTDCNLALGRIYDDPARLLGLIDYLKVHTE